MLGFDDGAGDVLARGDERVHQLFRALHRKAPVRGERDDAKATGGGPQRFDQVVVVLPCGIEVVQRPGHQHVAVGVEALGERATLVVKIAFHLKLDVLGAFDVARLQLSAEPLAHAVVGQIGDVAHHAREHESQVRVDAQLPVVAAVKLRIGDDGLPGDLVEGDVLGGQPGCARDQHGGVQAIGIVGCPAHGLHAAETSSNHGRESIDAQVVGEQSLSLYPVLDRDDGEIRPEGLARAGINRGGPRAPVAAAEIVGADDEKAVGVDGLAGPDAVVPPAGSFVVLGVVAGRVMAAGESVADEYCVAPGSVQPPVRLIDELEPLQGLAASKREAGGVGEDLGADEAH